MAKHLVNENSNRHSASLGLVIVDVVGRACAAAFAVGLLSGVRVLFVPGNYLKNFRHIVRPLLPSFVRHVSLICIIKERSSSQTFANGKKGERRRRRGKKWRPIIKSTVGAPHNMLSNKKALFTEETATDKRNRGIARDRVVFGGVGSQLTIKER